MKNKFMVSTINVIMATAVALTTWGCGSEANMVGEVSAVSESNADDKVSANTESELTEEATGGIYRGYYDISEEWNEIDGIATCAVQLDDMIYMPGIKMGEVVERLEKSQVNYIYDYDGEQIIPKDEHGGFRVYLGDEESFTNPNADKNDCWFSFLYVNTSKEDVPLKECAIANINVSDNFRCIDGTYTKESVQGMTKDEVEALEKSVFANVTRAKDQGIWNRHDDGEEVYCVGITFTLNKNVDNLDRRVPNMEWSNYDLLNGFNVVFCVNDETNKVEDLMFTGMNSIAFKSKE